MDWKILLVHEPFKARIPCLYITFYQDDLSLRVGIDEFLGKADTWCVGHGAIIAKELIPVLSSKGFAVVVVFCFQSGCPQREMVEIIIRCVAMVGIETVPVRAMPKESTCIGTVRALSRLFRLDPVIVKDSLYG